VPRSILTGRAVAPIMVRPRDSTQRRALVAAAKHARVSLSYYLLESALMTAAEEGFSAATPEGWRPRGGRMDPPAVRIDGSAHEPDAIATKSARPSRG
jgi:hypothetical protein